MSEQSQSRTRTGSDSTVRRFRHRTEFTRSRDVFRHLQPWEDTYKPATITRQAFASSPDEPATSPEPCHDSALAAFAQLCALRLRVRRCLVTLSCAVNDYVLADVTRTSSLQSNGPTDDPGDALWIGTSVFQGSAGISGDAIGEWRTARSVRDRPTESGHYYRDGIDPHCLVVSDVRQNARYQQLPFFANGPWIRFYSSVPLRGVHGSVIGSLAILDDAPRYGLSASELTFLEDLSDTIMEHLDATIVRSQRQRGERLIQGIGLFNSGKNSLRDWWLTQDDGRILRQGRYANIEGATERQHRIDTEFGVQADRDGDQYAKVPFKDKDVIEGEGYSQLHDQGEPARLGASNRKLPHSPTPRRRPGPTTRKTRTKGAEGNHFDLVSESAKAFGRASSLLREAMSVDGIVFANANSVSSMKREESQSSDASNPSSSSENLAKLSSDAEVQDSATEKVACTLQGFATRTHSSLAGFESHDSQFVLSKDGLRRLMTRYPKGFVFHFDEAGESHCSSDESSSTSADDSLDTERKRRISDGRLLAKAIRGVRTIAFLPLWNDHTERWHSCMFAWSTSSKQYFDGSETLTYLTSFGHSLLATLTRLESLAADKAKGSFISSISHELRSPLHGILAGVEFIQESDLTAYQGEMALTIDMAAKTLLDTINHILDYAKISHQSRATQKRIGSLLDSKKSRGAISGDGNATPTVELARLTEEVVETTISAHRMKTAGSNSSQTEVADLARHHPQHRTRFVDAKSLGNDGVSVTLDIDFRNNWNVRMQPGAWTRILTNLLGNALKYTLSGHIHVRLYVDALASEERSDGVPVKLIIRDTGIGISESFQAQGLFTPFKQEDALSAGTGLGLSIVKQIAESISGELQICSRSGEGTEATVEFLANFVSGAPVENSDTTPDILNDEVAFDHFHLCSGESLMDDDIPSVGRSVLQVVSEWTKCSSHHGGQVERTEGTSVCAITDDDLSALQGSNPESLARMLAQAAEQHSHILVLASSCDATSLPTWDSGYPLSPVFVRQPIGPRKLLRAIASARDSFAPGYKHDAADSSPKPNDTASEVHSGGGESTRANSSVELSQMGSGLAIREASYPVQTRPSLPTRPSELSQNSVSETDWSPITPIAASLSGFEQSPRQQDGEGNTILLVEDNEINMKLLVALMKKLQIEHRCAVNGHEALTMYRTDPRAFFLVLMDMNMPVMDGFTSAAEMRIFEKKMHLFRTRIVALTGVTNAEAKQRAFDCGMNEFYSKPFKMKELREVVERARRRTGDVDEEEEEEEEEEEQSSSQGDQES